MTDQSTDQGAGNDATADTGNKATIANLDGVFEDDSAAEGGKPKDTDKDETGADADTDEGKADKGDKSNAEADDADDQSEEGGEDGEDGEAEGSATPADEDKKSVPYKALKAERTKRQELEAEVEALRNQINPPKEDEELPDPADDPEAYEKAVEARVLKKQKTTKFNNSRKAAMEKHDDYEANERVFLLLATDHPSLKTKLNEAPDPAQFAYDTAIAHRKKLRDEIRAEIKAEEEAGGKDANDKGDKKPKKDAGKKSATDVPNLNKAAAAGSNSNKPEKAQSLNDVMEGSTF